VKSVFLLFPLVAVVGRLAGPGHPEGAPTFQQGLHPASSPRRPAMVELAPGEIAHNIGTTRSFFKAESTPDTKPGLVQAATPPRRGQGLLHPHRDRAQQPAHFPESGRGLDSQVRASCRSIGTAPTKAPGSTPRCRSRWRRETGLYPEIAADKAAADFPNWRKQADREHERQLQVGRRLERSTGW